MRPRKLAGAALQASEEPRDDLSDVFPPDDGASSFDTASSFEELPAGTRVCIACGGGHGGAREGCEAHEIARFHAPTRTVSEAVARLRVAAAEHRAASRALRVLAMAEVARDRAEIEAAHAAEARPAPARSTSPAVALEAAPDTTAACPRCAERDGETVEAGAPAPRGTRRRPRSAAEQQAFLFASEPEPQAP